MASSSSWQEQAEAALHTAIRRALEQAAEAHLSQGGDLGQHLGRAVVNAALLRMQSAATPAEAGKQALVAVDVLGRLFAALLAERTLTQSRALAAAAEPPPQPAYVLDQQKRQLARKQEQERRQALERRANPPPEPPVVNLSLQPQISITTPPPETPQVNVQVPQQPPPQVTVQTPEPGARLVRFFRDQNDNIKGAEIVPES
jgi:hypothetical protein